MEKFKVSIKEKLTKDVANTTVSVDVPRLVTNVIILDLDGNVLWKKKDNENSATVLVRDYLCVLSNILNVDEFPIVRYEELTKDMESVFGMQFKKFLSEVSSDYPGMMNILKCMNQGFIVPSISLLKQCFKTVGYDFLDIKGKWKFTVTTSPSTIVITSNRWERSTPEQFHFCWDLSITLSKDGLEYIDSDMYITEISFIREDTTILQKKSIFETIIEIYSPTEENNII